MKVSSSPNEPQSEEGELSKDLELDEMKPGGYPSEIQLNPKDGTQFRCNLCHKLPRDAVDLSCVAHENSSEELDESAFTFCEICLKSYLAAHNNLCPLNNHENPSFESDLFIRRHVMRTSVLCPRAIFRLVCRPLFPTFFCTLPLFFLGRTTTFRAKLHAFGKAE